MTKLQYANIQGSPALFFFSFFQATKQHLNNIQTMKNEM